MATLDHPRFGQLRYKADEESWIGSIHLPHFAKCHVEDESSIPLESESENLSVTELREKNRQARDEREFAAGRFKLMIYALDHQPPSDAQQRAFELLLEREDVVLTNILQSIVNQYRGQDYWTYEGNTRDFSEPRVHKPAELKRQLRLNSVLIGYAAPEGESDAIPITFYFQSPLDDEHGIEVTTVGTEVDDPYADEPPLDSGIPAFPFSLPPTIDATHIPPSTKGHRFVELRYGDRWSGVFVLDASLKCVGVVVGTIPHSFSDPNLIQDVRAVTRLRRWQTSWRTRSAAMTLVGALNLLVAVPCLFIAWVYEPSLYWLCLTIGIFAHAVYLFFQTSRRYWVGLATAHIILSVCGLYFDKDMLAAEGQQRVAKMQSVVGDTLWWGATLATIIAFVCVIGGIVASRKDLRRYGWSAFQWVSPWLLGLPVLVLSLIATRSWGWSKLHLLWSTPLSFMGIVFLYFLMPDTQRQTPCPQCGKPLASRAARQCLHCGADWHAAPN